MNTCEHSFFFANYLLLVFDVILSVKTYRKYIKLYLYSSYPDRNSHENSPNYYLAPATWPVPKRTRRLVLSGLS